MKRTFLKTILILTSVIIFSFNVKTDNEELVITVTADKQTKFDMFQDSKTIKGLNTPYEIKINSDDSRFIFKSKSSKTSLKITAKKKGGGEVYGSWPIVVLLVDGKKLTTFGIE